MKFWSFIIFSLILVFPSLNANPENNGETSSPVIGQIYFNRLDVFEPSVPNVNSFPYSWANNIHVVSRESFVRKDLIFEEGEAFDLEKIRESERILRRRGLFRKVKIIPQEQNGDTVDIEVNTQDAWTTSADARFELAGGEDSYRFGLYEQNLGGYGITAGAFIEQKIDRFIKGASLKIPHFPVRRWEFMSGYGEDEKGHEALVALERPFYSIYTKQGGGTRIINGTDEDRLFRNGEEVATFQHDTQEVRTFYSRALVRQPGRIRRVGVVHEYEKDEFKDYDFSIDAALPQDRTLSGALLAWDESSLNYIKRQGVTSLDRDEDINLGWRWSMAAGPSLEAFGATRDTALVRTLIGKNWALPSDVYVFSHAAWKARYESGVVRNGEYDFGLRAVFHEWRPKNTFVSVFRVEGAKNMDPENQYLLGGENGLRGYSVRQFEGNKKMLLNFENRRILKYDFLNLVSFGWALFADAGGAWDAGESMAWEDLKSDAGVGIRFSPTRSVTTTIIRADLAYAFNDNNRSSQWVVNIGGDVAVRFGTPRKFDQ